MADVCIVWFSGRGHTSALADEIAGSLVAAGLSVRRIEVANMGPADWHALNAAAAIVMGTPTYMGSAAAEFKAFMDASSDVWSDQLWVDKLAAGFTVATFPGGDKLVTLQQLAVFAAQHGMVWLGQDQIGAPVDQSQPGINASGVWLGLGAVSDRDKAKMVPDGDRESARRFGARIARAVRRWG